MIRASWPLLLLILPSCFIRRQERNGPSDPTAVASLQPGTTTARQVVERLGAPTEVVQLGRRTAYRYDAASTKTAGFTVLFFTLFGSDTRSDRVWVFFDENEQLTHLGSTFAMHRTQYALPWENVHEAADNAARDAGRPGLGGQ